MRTAVELTVVGLLIAACIYMFVLVLQDMVAEVQPCNPICFPGSYDESNPDCFCNE